jgi:hypothetical protein
MDFIKDTVRGTSRFRGKFDENPSVAGQGFVHHEKRTIEINMEREVASCRPKTPDHAAIKVFERRMNGDLRASSAAVIKIVSIQMETAPMLARRFTIVCLLTMLFAMGFARIVAQSSDGPAEWRGDLPISRLWEWLPRRRQARLAAVGCARQLRGVTGNKDRLSKTRGAVSIMGHG